MLGIARTEKSPIWGEEIRPEKSWHDLLLAVAATAADMANRSVESPDDLSIHMRSWILVTGVASFAGVMHLIEGTTALS